MTNEWDSVNNIPPDHQTEFGCGRIVARMPDLDGCQPIQRPDPVSTPIRVIVSRFVPHWGLFSRFRQQTVVPDVVKSEQESSPGKRSKKPLIFASLIGLGILCIIIGGVVLYKQHRKVVKQAERAVARAKADAEAAEKAAKAAVAKAKADAEAAEKAAVEKAAAEKAAQAKAAAEKAAQAKAAEEKAAQAKAAAEKAAQAKAAEEKKIAEQSVASPQPDEKKPVSPTSSPSNPQSPWERPTTGEYSPWGMATTRQGNAAPVHAAGIPAGVQSPPMAQMAIPTAPGSIGQGQNPLPYSNNYGTMVAPPMVANNANQRHYAPQKPSSQSVAQNQGRVPIADSPLTYQNVTGMTASGHYVPSAVHELYANQGGSSIRPLGPIPTVAPPQETYVVGSVPPQQGQSYVPPNSPMVATTGLPPQVPPQYQQQQNYQPQANYYQPQTNYQPYQPLPSYQSVPQNSPGRLY